jgi:uncharacterized membrane protein YeiB
VVNHFSASLTKSADERNIDKKFVVMFFTMNYEQGWDWKTLEYDGLWTPLGTVRHLFYNGFHPVVPWLAFLFVGMVIGRQNMSDRVIRRRVFLWGAGIALAAEGMRLLLIQTFSLGANLTDQEVIVAIFGTEPMPSMPFYMMAAGGTAGAVIAVTFALGEQYGDSAWLRPFIATGQLALTLYVAHLLIGMGILEAIGRLENQTLTFALMTSGVFWVTGVVFAHLWRRRFKRGPFETIMRTVTAPRKNKTQHVA